VEIEPKVLTRSETVPCSRLVSHRAHSRQVSQQVIRSGDCFKALFNIDCYWNMCSEAWLQRLLRKQTLCVTSRCTHFWHATEADWSHTTQKWWLVFHRMLIGHQLWVGICQSLFNYGSIVMSRGNPWIQQAIPLPLPPKTPTPHQGYGFLKGLNIHTLTYPYPSYPWLKPLGFDMSIYHGTVMKNTF